MSYQEALTVLAPIRPGQIDTAKQTLGTIPDHVDAWDVIPFDKLPRLHFARLAVFDEARDLNGEIISAQLALMTNVDGPVDAHLNDLVRVASPGLDAVFGACAGYPDESQRTPATRLRFLRRYQRDAAAFYVNRQGRSVTCTTVARCRTSGSATTLAVSNSSGYFSATSGDSSSAVSRVSAPIAR